MGAALGPSGESTSQAQPEPEGDGGVEHPSKDKDTPPEEPKRRPK
jgi:hypothetical protein